MIKARDLSLRYPDGTLALDRVNIDIKPGELVYITGPSGSGKTSFLKLILGMEYPTTGTLHCMDIEMKSNRKRKKKKLRRKIGPVFQEFKLIEGRTALENVRIGMRFLGVSPKKTKEVALNALDKVGLSDKKEALVENLSWGQAQRVAIARAVARKPILILADEPTGNLDYDNAIKILEIFKSFRQHDVTVIITTHATHLIEDEKDATFIRVDNGKFTVERRD